MKYWLLLFVSATANACANILIKAGAKVPQSVLLILFGLLLFACSFVSYVFVLRVMQLSVAYPFMVGFGFLIVSIASFLIFGESFSLTKITGILLILLGIFFLTR